MDYVPHHFPTSTRDVVIFLVPVAIRGPKSTKVHLYRDKQTQPAQTRAGTRTQCREQGARLCAARRCRIP